jgi:hypothetical protein
MSGFSADWLARREPYDQRARNATVLAAVAEAFAAYSSVAVVDLACGTGATLRAMSSVLPSRQNWRLIDNDLSLLARAQQATRPEMTVRAVPLDLARDLEAALDGPVDLVTTTALLDLVSGEWLERLATEIAARNLPFYAALSVDGRIAFDPSDPADETVFAAFNRHQRTDKGFGPALGADAVPAATALFSRIGYRVMQGPSDWVLGPADALQADLMAGLAAAASEAGANRAEVADWAARRAALIEARRSSLRVGHVDFFARPTGRR